MRKRSLSCSRPLWEVAVLLVGSMLSLVSFMEGCSDDANSWVSARRVMNRGDLIGGPSALGEVGDFLLENEKVRFIIQDKGFSRGFGVYGGSLIDADIVRPIGDGDSLGGQGRDSFGELFPTFFLQAVEPQSVEISADGSDGEAARVTVRGAGGEFLSLTRVLNRVLVNSYEGPDQVPLGTLLGSEGLDSILSDNPQLSFSVTYELRPGEPFLRIRGALTNDLEEPVTMPSKLGEILFNLPLFKEVIRDPFQVPLGFVTLFGGGNSVFAPGVGFDIRFTLEGNYEAGEAAEVEAEEARAAAAEAGTPFDPRLDRTLSLPALPGILSEGLIAANEGGVSYGLFLAPGQEKESFVYNQCDPDEEGEIRAVEEGGCDEGYNAYEQFFGRPIRPEEVLIPFSASSFTGFFSAALPRVIEPGETFEVEHLFVVGSGDVASVLDHWNDALGRPRGEVVGELRDAVSDALVEGASVIIRNKAGQVINQVESREGGRLRFTLAPGDYSAQVHRAPLLGAQVPFTVTKDGAQLRLSAPSAGTIAVEVRDEVGRPIPAKVTVVGTVDREKAGQPLRTHLFDLAAGQRWRVSDAIPDDPTRPGETMRYIAADNHGGADGLIEVEVPPGEWEVYLSRGTEYSLYRARVKVEAGRRAFLQGVLRREVETKGYLSADFHLHAAPSLDSDLPLRRRVRSAAGEGLEFLVATDHNFITDYQPSIEREGLSDWLSSMIGLELTTLEAGHFNTFPLRREVGEITKGAFEWSLRSPDELFAEARQMSSVEPAETIIQVNHPRDMILGYFDQYELDALTGELRPPAEEVGLDGVLSQLLIPRGPSFSRDGVSQFSFDFNALEVLNHGLFHEEFHARLPSKLGDAKIYDDEDEPLSGEEVAALPVGEILCEGGEVAFPGVIDDWFNFLNIGYRITGTANSDSHHREDIGFPRTYLRVGHDEPSQSSAEEIAAATRAHRATMSRGPFLELFVNGTPIGEELRLEERGEVEVRVHVQAPSWISVQRGRLILNGEVIERFPVDFGTSQTMRELRFTVPIERDSWIVADVRGDRSMFPVAQPVDLPPILLNEAFGTIAGPLGLDGGPLEELQPSMTGPFTPYALTNPIWLKVGEGEWSAPGVLPRRCGQYVAETIPDEGEKRLDGSSAPAGVTTPAPISAAALRRVAKRRGLQRSFGFPRIRGDLRDVRVLIEQFATHAH
ncbi:MAG: CehA/McbA family metallohydrolase [Myxococcota bacterium]|nr:CehA/McbA family metallohydrolase [Myxococcota bacterium]